MIIVRICTLYSPMRVFLPVSFSMFAVGSRPLYLHFSDGGPFHEHERADVRHGHHHFHDEPDFRADLPNAIRKKRGERVRLVPEVSARPTYADVGPLQESLALKYAPNLLLLASLLIRAAGSSMPFGLSQAGVKHPSFGCRRLRETMNRVFIVTTSFPDASLKPGQDGRGFCSGFCRGAVAAGGRHRGRPSGRDYEIGVTCLSSAGSLCLVAAFLLEPVNPPHWPAIIKTLRAGRRR